MTAYQRVERESLLPFHSSTVCSLSSSCLSEIIGGGWAEKNKTNKVSFSYITLMCLLTRWSQWGKWTLVPKRAKWETYKRAWQVIENHCVKPSAHNIYLILMPPELEWTISKAEVRLNSPSSSDSNWHMMYLCSVAAEHYVQICTSQDFAVSSEASFHALEKRRGRRATTHFFSRCAPSEAKSICTDWVIEFPKTARETVSEHETSTW